MKKAIPFELLLDFISIGDTSDVKALGFEYEGQRKFMPGIVGNGFPFTIWVSESYPFKLITQNQGGDFCMFNHIFDNKQNYRLEDLLESIN
jgi:hypothetical protein